MAKELQTAAGGRAAVRVWGVTISDIPSALRKAAVLSAADWRATGLSDGQMRSLIRSGDLVRLRRGVYATRRAIEFSQEEGHGGRHLLLAVGAQRVVRRSVISHHSAARAYGLDMLNPPSEQVITLTLPPGRYSQGLRASGVIKHRAAVPEGHATQFRGARLTSPARTVVDISRTSTFMQGVVVTDSVLRLEKATDAQLRRVLDDCPRWPGIDVARRVVQFADPLAESVLESCARVVFREHGLEAPELQVWIPGTTSRVDFCWPGHRVIVEADGLGKYEDDPKRKIADQTRRDNALRREGYAVIHFTWAELFGQPEVLVADIRRALTRVR